MVTALPWATLKGTAAAGVATATAKTKPKTQGSLIFVIPPTELTVHIQCQIGRPDSGRGIRAVDREGFPVADFWFLVVTRATIAGPMPSAAASDGAPVRLSPS